MFVNFVMEEYNIITYFYGLNWLRIMFKSKCICLCVEFLTAGLHHVLRSLLSSRITSAPPTGHIEYRVTGLNVLTEKCDLSSTFLHYKTLYL